MQGGGQGAGHSPAAAEWPWLGPWGGGHAAAGPPLPPSPVLACTLVMGTTKALVIGGNQTQNTATMMSKMNNIASHVAAAYPLPPSSSPGLHDMNKRKTAA